MRKLSVFEPFLVGNEAEWITRTLAANEISGTSPVIAQFEQAFSQFRQVPHTVAVANGTAAIHVALLALGIKEGDEVIVPDFTIISDAIGVILCGATPVFVDVSAKDYCIDVSQIEKAITPQTKAILAVHMYGNSCDMEALSDICKKHKLSLVEDTAQAMDATWKGKALGSFGDMATYSFYSNKLITTGEGGAVTANEKTFADKAKVIRNLGFDPNPDRRFIHAFFSNNYRLSGIQAAMGLAQLEAVHKLTQMRNDVRERYMEHLSGIPSISLSEAHPSCSPSFWMQTVVLNDDVKLTVPDLGLRLMDKGIETRRFFYPLHRQPVLKKYHSQDSSKFPVSEKLFERGIYLPSSCRLSSEDIRYVTSSLREVL